MSKIKVVQIVEATVGGIKEHLRQILANIDRDRFDLTVIYSAERTPDFVKIAERYCSEGIPTVQIPMVRPVSPLRDYRCYRKLLWNMRFTKYDVIHTHGTKAGVLGRFAARHAMGTPKIIHTGHTFPIQWAKGFSAQLVEMIERRAMLHTDRLIALTMAQKILLVSRGICGADKIAVIPNAVEAEAFPGPERKSTARKELAIPPDCPVVGMVGRAVEQKNPVFFLHTARHILAHQQDARFVWIGDGPLHQTMEQTAAELGFADRLLVTGTREDVRDLYPAFDVFLMTSRYEGLAYVLLEAMAAGVPPVVVNIPGMDEVIQHKVNGLVVPPDAEALAVEVVELLENETMRRNLGNAAREHVRENFNPRKFITELEALYVN